MRFGLKHSACNITLDNKFIRVVKKQAVGFHFALFDVASENSLTADYAGFGKFGNSVSCPKITEINDLIFMILLILHLVKRCLRTQVSVSAF